jgi:hypothetical protein
MEHFTSDDVDWDPAESCRAQMRPQMENAYNTLKSRCSICSSELDIWLHFIMAEFWKLRKITFSSK